MEAVTHRFQVGEHFSLAEHSMKGEVEIIRNIPSHVWGDPSAPEYFVKLTMPNGGWYELTVLETHLVKK